jgi:hypothetical protein
VAGFCERYKEHLGSVKGDEYVDQIVITVFYLKIVFHMRMDEGDSPF